MRVDIDPGDGDSETLAALLRQDFARNLENFMAGLSKDLSECEEGEHHWRCSRCGTRASGGGA